MEPVSGRAVTGVANRDQTATSWVTHCRLSTASGSTGVGGTASGAGGAHARTELSA
ncbi:hypothetical protein ABT237_24210 [Streptomyces sp. NPDC001581]|uniref:hypothetical protein n=1 Tax=Streptomyces sp. NPDC001581 TaxID=3154386 RepID=UPI0033329751